MSYAIQGLRNGKWVTLFAPIATSNEAVLRVRELAKANPACRYRVRWFVAGEPIVE